MNHGRSWLCPTDLDRARLLENSERVRRARLAASSLIGLALVALAPHLGWHLLALFAASAVIILSHDWRMGRTDRPERTVAATLLLTELAIAVGVATTGGGESPLLPWLAIPVAMSAARFRMRVVHAGAIVAMLMLAAATLAVDRSAVFDAPALSIVTLALIGNVVAAAGALQRAELHHRSESVLDQLTGLLNRKALTSRFAELSEQARVSGGPVSLIAIDIDSFKAVNDTRGHACGDSALRDFAYELRKATRNFELIYRFGGEEFVVLLPGLELPEAVRVAERLRATIARIPLGGCDLTISAGVASARGADVELHSLFERADSALYRAKAAGRNRVAADPERWPGGAPEPSNGEAAGERELLDVAP